MALAMAMMHAVYYRDPGGNEPVDDFIEQLQPEQARVVIDNQIDRLNMLRTNDPPLPFPHSSQIAGELGNSAAITVVASSESSTAVRTTSSSFCTPSKSVPSQVSE